MSSLLWHRPSLWITHKENRRAQCGLLDANDYKCSQDQLLGVNMRFEHVQKTMYGANVIIFEGILAFYNAEVVRMLDMKVFVDTDADVRLARRLRR
jgi:uridine kinase